MLASDRRDLLIEFAHSFVEPLQIAVQAGQQGSEANGQAILGVLEPLGYRTAQRDQLASATRPYS